MSPTIPDAITPKEFELCVKEWFEAAAGQTKAFQAEHREKLRGSDGEYEIDVTIRFKAFGGADFLALVECKKHSHPIKRQTVELLHARLGSTGAHKGFIVSTTEFQSGAKEYAEKHGIALIRIHSGYANYIRNGPAGPVSADSPGYFGLYGNELLLINEDHPYTLRELVRCET